MMITIGYLADYRESIPTLVTWFRDQWPDYYASWSREDMEMSFGLDASRNRIPCRLVAFESNVLAGTIVLREHSSESLPEYQPELGGLYVAEFQRGHGIGTALVRAGMKVGRDLGYKRVFATTLLASGILERSGWEFIKTVTHQDGPLRLYRCLL